MIFQFQFSSFAGIAFKETVAKAINAIVLAKFENEAMQTERTGVPAKAEQLQNNNVVEKRSVKFIFLEKLAGVQEVTNPMVEFEVPLLANIRDAVLFRQGGADLFNHEEIILGIADSSAPTVACTAPSFLLEPMREARRIIQDHVSKHEPKNLGELMRAFDKGYDAAVSIDRGIRLDKAVLDNSQDMFTDLLQAEILRNLPSEDISFALEQSVLACKSAQTSKKYTFAPAPSQRCIDAVVEILEGMTENLAPDVFIGIENPFYGKVLQRLQIFVRSDGSGGIIGAAALKQQFECMKMLMDANDPSVTFDDLEVFHKFKWLLGGDSVKTLADWVTTLAGKLPSSTRISKKRPCPLPSNALTAKKTPADVAREKDPAMSEILLLFKFEGRSSSAAY